MRSSGVGAGPSLESGGSGDGGRGAGGLAPCGRSGDRGRGAVDRARCGGSGDGGRGAGRRARWYRACGSKLWSEEYMIFCMNDFQWGKLCRICKLCLLGRNTSVDEKSISMQHPRHAEPNPKSPALMKSPISNIYL
jgi:hypothetical protein